MGSRLTRRTAASIGRRLFLGAASPFLVAAAALALFNAIAAPEDGLIAPPPAGTTWRCRAESVLDGDTVDFDCPSGLLRVRLWGIDAPELGQTPWGDRSARRLGVLIGRSAVVVRTLEVGVYGRAVGTVHKAGQDIGLTLVSEGWATVRTRYVRDEIYRNARRDARRRSVGIWSQPGLHQRPWEWRRLNPPAEAGTPPVTGQAARKLRRPVILAYALPLALTAAGRLQELERQHSI